MERCSMCVHQKTQYCQDTNLNLKNKPYRKYLQVANCYNCLPQWTHTYLLLLWCYLVYIIRTPTLPHFLIPWTTHPLLRHFQGLSSCHMTLTPLQGAMGSVVSFLLGLLYPVRRSHLESGEYISRLTQF